MANSGHEQLLNMAGEGKGKVDKTIRPPKGFGPVDSVFYRFQQRWRDEWRRRMRSQAGCDAIAGEWQHTLRRFSGSDIEKAVSSLLSNIAPPSLSDFVGAVERVIEDRKPAKRDLNYGRQQLESIKRQYVSGQGEVKH